MHPPLANAETMIRAIAAGLPLILVDDEDRENEGDIVVAADAVTPALVTLMATQARGLICLALGAAHCDRLQLQPMTRTAGSRTGTAFTVSIEAARGVTTGISALDRWTTIRAAIDPAGGPQDIVSPGHVFPLRARDGGVLERAGHTEAATDLARLAGRSEAAVICEVMNDDGTMARLPELLAFGARLGIPVGTIAELIAYRSRTESIVRRVHQRTLVTRAGILEAVVYRQSFGGRTHVALVKGAPAPGEVVDVRVHEPLSLWDLLDAGDNGHSWTVDAALRRLSGSRAGVMLLMNCESLPLELAEARSADAGRASRELRDHGVGMQILRDLGVSRMRVLAEARRMPSAAGFGIETVGFESMALTSLPRRHAQASAHVPAA
jgi:3,4-dihydroxy 2-butanone 4-phosphate synthase/GTP cyclohydrolase II